MPCIFSDIFDEAWRAVTGLYDWVILGAEALP